MKDLIEKIENKINCSLPEDYRNFLLTEEYNKYSKDLYNIRVLNQDFIFCYFLKNNNKQQSDLYLYNEYRFSNKDYMIFGQSLGDNEFAIYFKGIRKGKVYMTIDSHEEMVVVAKTFTEFLNMLRVIKD